MTRSVLVGCCGVLAADLAGGISGQPTCAVGGITAARRTANQAEADRVQITVAGPVSGTITTTVGTDPSMPVDRTYTDPYGNLRGGTAWPAATGFLNEPHGALTGLRAITLIGEGVKAVKAVGIAANAVGSLGRFGAVDIRVAAVGSSHGHDVRARRTA